MSIEVIVSVIGLFVVVAQIYTGLIVKNLDGKMRGIKDLFQKDMERIAESTKLRKETRDEQIKNIKEDIIEIKTHIARYKK